MILIADSGSTKTDWSLVDELSVRLQFSTQGLNPFHQTEEQIVSVLDYAVNQTRSLCSKDDELSVYFYGAGCTPDKCVIIEGCFRSVCDENTDIHVYSDMLGAARSLCGHSAGIACILGTGSNSCLYDGRDVTANVSPLGYILGDEGSAAYIGKRLVADVLKCQLPPSVCNMFFAEVNLTAADIVNKVYRESLPNRFLGQLSQFCQRHLDVPEISEFITDCFREFFRRNILNYGHPEMSVHFIGSIAWVYSRQLCDAAVSMGLKVGNICRTPMQGLIDYHLNSAD